LSNNQDIVAIGYTAIATNGTVSIGSGATAGVSATNSVIIGFNASASGTDSVAIGNGTSARATLVTTICNAACFSVEPTAATTNLGSATIRWAEVFAVLGAINTSDRREKKSIVDSDLGLSFIRSLRPVKYEWKTGRHVDKAFYGFIAQELQEVLAQSGRTVQDFAGLDIREADAPHPEAKDGDNDEFTRYGVRYTEFVAPLVAAVQELSGVVDLLKSANDKKDAIITDILARLTALEKV
jgi:autotransporter adhesin